MIDPEDAYLDTRARTARQIVDDLRRDDPWLWCFATLTTWIMHPAVMIQRLWLKRAKLARESGSILALHSLCGFGLISKLEAAVGIEPTTRLSKLHENRHLQPFFGGT